MLRPLAALLCISVLAACPGSSAPAARSPLREQLAASDNPTVEQAARTCLEKTGWKVDPIGGVSGGANVVTAYKAKEQTDVYIYPPKTTPRITGGPDFNDKFWTCLGGQLGSSSGAGGGEDKAGGDDKSDKAGEDKPKADPAH
jgi:hypothetical protein